MEKSPFAGGYKMKLFLFLETDDCSKCLKQCEFNLNKSE